MVNLTIQVMVMGQKQTLDIQVQFEYKELKYSQVSLVKYRYIVCLVTNAIAEMVIKYKALAVVERQ